LPGELSQVTGYNFVYTLTAESTKFAETKSYKLAVKSVPTVSDAATADLLGLTNVVLSVGLSTAGGKGWSQAQGFTNLVNGALPDGTQLLDFLQPIVSINRGTYTENAVCVVPGVAGDAFQGDFTFRTTSSQFTTVPAEAAGKMGDSIACLTLGAASSTAATVHYSYWTTSGANISPLGALLIDVGREQTQVNVPAEVTCQAGGFSYPMLVDLDATPFTDITVALGEDVDNTDPENPVDNSYGVTIEAASAAGQQFAIGAAEQIFSFECAADANATSLKYTLTGTDADNFRLATDSVAVTVLPALEDSAQPEATVTLQRVDDISDAGTTFVEGQCPGMGASYIYWEPANADAVAFASWDEVEAAWEQRQADEATHGDDDQHWDHEQMCRQPVTAVDEKT